MSVVIAALLAVRLAGPPPPDSLTVETSEAVVASGRSALSLGVLELRHGDSAVGQVGVEVRMPWGRTGPVSPLVGFTLTSAVSAFGFGGIAVDIPLGARLRIAPSFAAGLYVPGEGKPLHGPLQFRTALAFTIRVAGERRLGIALTHVSNGGLAVPNPGVESLALVYEVPF